MLKYSCQFLLLLLCLHLPFLQWCFRLVTVLDGGIQYWFLPWTQSLCSSKIERDSAMLLDSPLQQGPQTVEAPDHMKEHPGIQTWVASIFSSAHRIKSPALLPLNQVEVSHIKICGEGYILKEGLYEESLTDIPHFFFLSPLLLFYLFYLFDYQKK